MVNWKVRVSNPHFWVTLIPAMVVLAQAVASVFGVTLDLSTLTGKLLAVVDALFVVLTIVGLINDPTTAKFSDSNQAMTYEQPHDDMAGLR